jgi:hypothetical protein
MPRHASCVLACCSLGPHDRYNWSAAGLSSRAGSEPLRGRGATRRPGMSPDKARAAAARHAAANAGYGPYLNEVHDAISAVDESALNYELLEAACSHVIAAEAAHGPLALLRGWPGLDDAPDGGTSELEGPGAILVFLPGALEIAKAQRQLEGSGARSWCQATTAPARMLTYLCAYA